ncbi:general transcription factor IIH subunit 3 [Tetranychus urticae]|uniref:General transcription factor IIH subunit 3 n=1 Tax=Tetranychus urticae TaxID=32264 RepID=T1JYT6_TETUR|nr:general transcription factor IIH subunit 3 [Tetranychus urticae]
MESAESEKNLKTHLVIIIDLSPNIFLFQRNDSSYEMWLNSLISFCNIHLLMNNENMLHIIGSHYNGNTILYPSESPEGIDFKESNGQYELFTILSRTIHTQIKKAVRQCRQTLETIHQSRTGETIKAHPLISGALAMGLCCIQRYKSDVDSSRIAVIAASNYDSTAFTSQYMNFMNVFFTAQKMGIVIDSCVLSPNEPEDMKDKFSSRGSMSILQQGSDLTSGIYLKVAHVNAFLEYLIWTMLPDSETRQKLVLPTQRKVSYKAACFCHRNLIDIGYVCSVCLSIFCSFSPICSTCNTVFKLGPIPQGIKLKRKPKIK